MNTHITKKPWCLFFFLFLFAATTHAQTPLVINNGEAEVFTSGTSGSHTTVTLNDTNTNLIVDTASQLTITTGQFAVYGGTVQILTGGTINVGTTLSTFNLNISSGHVLVDGLGSRLLSYSMTVPIYVGNASGSMGSLTIQNNAYIGTNNGVNIGQADFSSGHMTVGTSGSIVTKIINVGIGDNSSGTLDVFSSGSIGALALNIAVGASSSGIVTVNGTGSVLTTSTERLIVGQGANSSGTLIVESGGQVKTDTAIFMGFIEANSTSVLTIRDGGKVESKDLTYGLFIGRGNGGNATLTVDGVGSTLEVKHKTTGSALDTWLAGDPNVSATLILSNSGSMSARNLRMSQNYDNVAITASSAVLIIGNGEAAGTLNLTGSIIASGTANKIIFNQTDAEYTFATGMTGTIAINHNAVGITRLTGASALTAGSTNITNGALVYGNTAAIGNTPIIVAEGAYVGMTMGGTGFVESDLYALFDLYNGTSTTGVWKNVAFSTPNTAGIAIDVAAGGTFTYSAPNDSTAAIMKTGDGTMILTMDETFKSITVAGGALVLDYNSFAPLLNTSKISILNNATFDVSELGGFTISNGKTLAGNGKVVGMTTVSGTLAPAGTLTFDGGLSITNTATINMSVDDLIAITNSSTLTLQNGVKLNISGEMTSDFLPLFDITDGTLAGGSWASFQAGWTVTGLPGEKGEDWWFAEKDGQLGIQVIPEPGTWAMILTGLGTLAGIQRFRRRL